MKPVVFLLCLITGLTWALEIYQIQGTSSSSPYVGQTVTTEGVVTWLDARGAYIQSINPDQDPRTSEGIYLYFGRQPTVAVTNLLRVRGKVTEFDQQTQLTHPQVQIIAQQAELPEALPLPNLQWAEQVEGMRVSSTSQITDLYWLQRYGSAVLANGYVLDDNSFTTQPARTSWQMNVRAGQDVNIEAGIVVHRFDQYRLFTDSVSLSGNPTPSAPAKPNDVVRVVHINLQNLFNGNGRSFSDSRGATSLSQWRIQLAKTAQAIRSLSPDILAVSEIENDYGDPSPTIEALAAATGLTAISLEQPLGRDAIAVGLLYNPSLVQLDGRPNRLANIAFGNRVPLAQRFLAKGKAITLSSHHWRSKRCRQNDCGEQARLAAARQSHLWHAEQNNVLLVGDLNSYVGDPAWQSLVQSGWQPLLSGDTYTYRYQGNAGALDHAMSWQLTDWQAKASVWHINADEAPIWGYQHHVDVEDVRRFSDHDPVIVDLK